MYVERLHLRNEFLIASHHPLQPTLIAQTGTSAHERTAMLQRALNEVTVGGPPGVARPGGVGRRLLAQLGARSTANWYSRPWAPSCRCVSKNSTSPWPTSIAHQRSCDANEKNRYRRGSPNSGTPSKSSPPAPASKLTWLGRMGTRRFRPPTMTWMQLSRCGGLTAIQTSGTRVAQPDLCRSPPKKAAGRLDTKALRPDRAACATCIDRACRLLASTEGGSLIAGVRD